MNKRLLYIILGTILIASCKRKNEACCQEKIISEKNTISIDFASNFDLIRTNVGYSLEILNPENGEVERSYSIQPDSAYKMISLSATLNGMISILNAQNSLVGIGDKNYIFDSKILANLENGSTQSFGNETNISLEKIVASKTNLLFYSGFGDAFPNEEKLTKLNISVIPIYDWRENHPLGKAEWIKVIGVITGKEKEANDYFQMVTKEYEKIRSITDTISQKPSVLAGSIFGDIWYAPGGKGYFAKLLEDAGANYIYKYSESSASQEFSMEKILNDNINTTYWINPTFPTLKALIKSNPNVKYLKAFKTNSYCYSHQMNKFWEQSAAMPHIVVKDLAQIFHPTVQLEKELYFYKKLE